MPNKNFRVNIPDLGSGSVDASSKDHATIKFSISRMRNKKSDIWWRRKHYLGCVGEKLLIEDILEARDKESFIQPSSSESKEAMKVSPFPLSSPQDLRIELPITVIAVIQLEFTTPLQIDTALESDYDEGYWYELETADPKFPQLDPSIFKATDSKEYKELREKHQKAKASGYKEVLRLRERRILRWEKYKDIASQLREELETNAFVQDLLEENDLTFNDLIDVDIVVSPYQACDNPPRITVDEIRIGFCRESNGMEHMFDSLIQGLAKWVQIKAGREQTETWRVHEREKESILAVIRLLREKGLSDEQILENLKARKKYPFVRLPEDIAKQWIAESKNAPTTAGLEEMLWQKRLPRAAIRNYILETSHPLWKYKQSYLVTHASECIIDKYASPDKTQTLAIDFDATIVQYDPKDFPKIGEPEPGAVKALNELHNLGYKIMIFSHRTKMPGQKQKVEEWLKKYEIPFDSIWEGSGKPNAAYFIDDKGIQYKGNWEEIVRDIKEKKASASLKCNSCDMNMTWNESKKLWKCAECDNHLILENACIWIFGLRKGDKVSYKVGNKNEISELVEAIKIGSSLGASRMIWKTSKGDLISRAAMEYIPEEKKNIEEESWLMNEKKS